MGFEDVPHVSSDQLFHMHLVYEQIEVDGCPLLKWNGKQNGIIDMYAYARDLSTMLYSDCFLLSLANRTNKISDV